MENAKRTKNPPANYKLGGARARSGRKPLPPEKRKRQIYFCVTLEQEKLLREYAKQIGI